MFGYFFHGKNYASVLTEKQARLHFRRVFSQTHLVTLLFCNTCCVTWTAFLFET
jgi:hypothetical protein